MTPLVVDACVGVKLVLPEDDSDVVESLFRERRRLLVPDLFFSETANVLWQRVRRGELTQEQAIESQRVMLALPLEVEASQPLVEQALVLACQIRCTVYDGLYVALAIREGARFLTADAKLLSAVSADPLVSACMLWIGNLER